MKSRRSAETGRGAEAARMGDLARRCRELGLPFTIQRRTVLSVLLGMKTHPTVEELYAEVSLLIPGVSKATVYRVLETFVGAGLVHAVAHPGSALRYDPKTYRHHHLVCERCGRIEDFEDPRFDGLPLGAARDTGFEAREYSVHLTGLCRACRRVKAKGKPVAKRY